MHNKVAIPDWRIIHSVEHNLQNEEYKNYNETYCIGVITTVRQEANTQGEASKPSKQGTIVYMQYTR